MVACLTKKNAKTALKYQEIGFAMNNKYINTYIGKKQQFLYHVFTDKPVAILALKQRYAQTQTNLKVMMYALEKLKRDTHVFY